MHRSRSLVTIRHSLPVPMPSRSQSRPSRQHAYPSESDNNITSGESSPSHEEAADLQLNQTEDTHMSDGTSHVRGTAAVRLRYVGKLEPAIIAAWLRDEVGLTAHDVSCRFRPFSFRAFDTNATTNPRTPHTELVPPEIHPGITDDSLPEFGMDLPWTPAHGPSGLPLRP